METLLPETPLPAQPDQTAVQQEFTAMTEHPENVDLTQLDATTPEVVTPLEAAEVAHASAVDRLSSRAAAVRTGRESDGEKLEAATMVEDYEGSLQDYIQARLEGLHDDASEGSNQDIDQVIDEVVASGHLVYLDTLEKTGDRSLMHSAMEKMRTSRVGRVVGKLAVGAAATGVMAATAWGMNKLGNTVEQLDVPTAAQYLAGAAFGIKGATAISKAAKSVFGGFIDGKTERLNDEQVNEMSTFLITEREEQQGGDLTPEEEVATTRTAEAIIQTEALAQDLSVAHSEMIREHEGEGPLEASVVAERLAKVAGEHAKRVFDLESTTKKQVLESLKIAGKKFIGERIKGVGSGQFTIQKTAEAVAESIS
jgi:hypothetical protein